MDSSSDSEFRYDGGDVSGGGAGMAIGILVLVIVVLIVLIVLFALSTTGTLSHSWAMMLTPSAQVAYVVANYKLAADPTATRGVCTMDATSKSFTCAAPEKEIDPTTGAVATTEHLSVIWKDKMLSSASADPRSMYRGEERMCGQC